MLFPLKITIFAHPNHSGCSSARLEYTSGGRVVAGSNPVIPTKLEQTAEHLFCCFFVVIALCASPPQNNKKPRTPCVLPALSVRRLVFFNIWLRGQGYFYCSAFSLRFILVVPARSELSAPPFKSSLPDKLEQTAEQCVLLFFVVESLGSLEKLEKLEKLGKLGKLESLGNPLIFTNHFHQACKTTAAARINRLRQHITLLKRSISVQTEPDHAGRAKRRPHRL